MLKEMEDDGIQVVNFDAAIYGLNAIRKASCKFDGRFYVLIEQHNRMTEVRLIPKECRKSPSAVVGEFCNEVLDQELRERVAAEMVGIRRHLLAKALFTTPLVGCG